MTTPGPFEGGNPFERLFGELAKMFSTQGPVNWQLARQWATQLAGADEPNVDPLDRMAFEELVRVADLHVGQATSLPTTATGRPPTVRAVTRSEWANRTLDDWKPLFEGMAGSLGRVTAIAPGEGDEAAADLLGGFTQFLAPVLLGVQAGSMVGHLALEALGQYHLPIPRPPSDELLVVPANVDTLAGRLDLSLDDVRLWALLDELAHHCVISRPHVRQRLTELITDYVALFEPDASSLEQRLGSIDPMNPASFQEVLGTDPAELISSLRSPAQRMLLNQISALVAVVEGYADHVVDRAAARLVGSHRALRAAAREQRTERREAQPILEALFGIELTPALYERGERFVAGVVEREGEEALDRLWASDRELPTPAEVDAPGLWWERINLPDDLEFPDEL